MPPGNYRYKRLPMDITPASKTFKATMIEQFIGVNGASIIQDDCLVKGFGKKTQTKPSITTTRTCKQTFRDAEKEISKLTTTNANSLQWKLTSCVIH